MQNKYKVKELAKQAGIALTKKLNAGTIELTVDRPLAELVDELRARGLL